MMICRHSKKKKITYLGQKQCQRDLVEELITMESSEEIAIGRESENEAETIFNAISNDWGRVWMGNMAYYPQLHKELPFFVGVRIVLC